MRGCGGAPPRARTPTWRLYGSPGSKPAAARYASHASSTVRAKTETTSSVRQAGTTPRVESAPRLGFSPTMLLRAAGTRPEPAVSVPSAKRYTSRRATATAEPALDPPGTSSGSMRIARDAIGRAHAHQSSRELVEIGLADDGMAPAIAQAVPPPVASASRIVGERRTGGGGGQARDIDVVLDGEGHAPERLLRVERAERRGFGEGPVGIDAVDEDRRVAGVGDAALRLGNHRRGAEPRAIGLAQCRQGEGQAFDHAFVRRPGLGPAGS
jgi:hypothetical protein